MRHVPGGERGLREGSGRPGQGAEEGPVGVPASGGGAADVPQEHRRELEGQGCVVREIEPVYPPENQTQFAVAYYVINYSKLRIWEVSFVTHGPLNLVNLFHLLHLNL